MPDNLARLVENVYEMIKHSPYHKGQRVLAGGRPATVKSICATGAVDVLTDDGALLTFVDGVVPLVAPAPVVELVAVAE